ncbi:MAG: choice-of-anchor D domain-containing protein [Ignavibacteriae bacterium]|nr:choice-of-anchor D domain-containing protein [Ignavibacteriota bacterium]
MKTCSSLSLIFVLFVIGLMQNLVHSQTLNFNVDSPADDQWAYPYDNPDTETDESSDGICRDSLGRCTLNAAVQEAGNMGESVLINIPGGTIVMVNTLPSLPDESVIDGHGTTIIDFNTASSGLGIGNSGIIKNLTVRNVGQGISSASTMIVDNVTFQNCVMAATLGPNSKVINSIIKNCQTGIMVTDSCIVGEPNKRNYFYGTEQTALSILGNSVTVQNNYVGLQEDGTTVTPNMFGISVWGENNTIGGNSASTRNVIVGSTSSGIEITDIMGSSPNRITGNYIGLTPAGTAAGNSFGIKVTGGVEIGSNVSGERNIISGNQIGVLVNNSFFGPGIIKITGNYIGTNPGGTAARPNESAGIQIQSSNHEIKNNLISGNTGPGIEILGVAGANEADGNIISGNMIGLNAAGTTGLANGIGISIQGNAENNIIGSNLTTDYSPNTIAYNGQAGIFLGQIPNPFSNPSGNSIRKNSIYDNSGLGIKFQQTTVQHSVTPPTLDSLVEQGGGLLRLYGSGAPANSKIDIYTAAPDPTENGEGKTWIQDGTTDASGNFQIDISASDCGDLTATATNTQGSTSEFSHNYKREPSSLGVTASCEGPFIAGVSYNVTYTLNINWGGVSTTGREVKFYLNGANEQTGVISGNTATATYDMAQSQSGTNTVTWQITTCVGQAPTSPGYTFCAIDKPSWLPTPSASCGGGTVQYEVYLSFPDNAVSCVTEFIPDGTNVFVEGALGFVGLPKASTTLKIPGTSDPMTTGFSFKIGDQGVSLNISGTVNSGIDCGGNTLTATGTATVTANVHKTFSLGWDFSPYLPSCTGWLGFPPVKQLCNSVHAVASAVNIGATVGGTITANASVGLPPLKFLGGSANATVYIRPFINFLTFHANGNGQVTFGIDIPSFNLQTPHAQVDFTASESITGWSYQFGPYTYPGAPPFRETFIADLMRGLTFAPEGTRYYFQDSTVATNVPNDAMPVFAFGSNGKAAAAWVAKHGSNGRPSGNISLKLFNGTTWGSTISLNNDVQVDQSPSIAIDNANHIIVAWERNSSLSVPTADSLLYSGDYLRGFDIQYAIVDATNGNIQQNNSFGLSLQYDAKPKLSKGSDGKVLLVWQQTLGNSFFGDSDDSLYFHGTWWDGTTWSSELTSAGLTGVLHWEPAVLNQDSAHVAYIKEMDDDFSTAQDWEVFTVGLNGMAWNVPQRITNDSRLDYGVHTTFTPDGQPVMTWFRDSVVVGVIGNLLQSPTTWLLPEHQISAEFINGAIRATSDSLVIAWTSGGKIQYSAASIAAQQFQKQDIVNFTMDAQQFPSLNIDSQGQLRLGYLQTPWRADTSLLSDTATIFLSTASLNYSTPLPRFSSSVASLDFGSLDVGTTKTDSIIISNTGVGNLNITSIISDDNEFTITPSSATISPSSSQKFTITFAPTKSGVKSNTITFIHNGETSPDVLHCSGTATGMGVTTLSLSSKWNLVSVPRLVENDSVQSLFPTAVSQAFRFDQSAGYIASTTLENGKGYWLKFGFAQSVNIAGEDRSLDTVEVKAGWNLIGGLSLSVSISNIVQVPSANVQSNYFGYDSGYLSTTTLAPGKSYWVKVSQDGLLILQAGGE